MRSALFLFFPLVIFIVLDILAFQTFKALDLGKIFGRVYWAIHGLGYAYILFAIFQFDPNASPEVLRRGMQGFMIYAIALYVPKLFPISAGLLEDLFRGGTWVTGHGWASRRKFVATLGWGLAAIPFLGILHGVFRGRFKYRVLTNRVTIPGLPKAFHGFRIVQISDIHSGSFSDPDEVRRGVDMVVAQRGDAVVFTGDLVNNVAEEMTPWIDLFKEIQAPHGVYSILGNHDYGDYWQWPSEQAKVDNLAALCGQHAALGWDLLRNEHRLIQKDGEQLELLGIENWGKPPFPQYGDLNKALAGLPPETPKILLSHDPSHYDAQVVHHPANIALTLSGHTHGMQFGIEIPGWFKWSPVKFKYAKWAGSYPESNQSRALYVNRGFGYLAFPGRVGIWPEVTVHELHPA
ncbi:MAG: metallophosphoesterase [Bacteroidetes bacterium]|nr:metallophosphoesterase [Bacteroidota bacterium]MDA0828283.1 metallophosphoesterase [Bacteroidota bacterium]MDA1199009.1 metallophosphoesterase [Bacteroidota bacterium]